MYINANVDFTRILIYRLKIGTTRKVKTWEKFATIFMSTFVFFILTHHASLKVTHLNWPWKMSVQIQKIFGSFCEWIITTSQLHLGQENYGILVDISNHPWPNQFLVPMAKYILRKKYILLYRDNVQRVKLKCTMK